MLQGEFPVPGPHDWLQLASGRQFWPTAPELDSIVIEDIAHALGNLCRFGGHAGQYYSVAEHSIHVSYLVDPQYALTALLHDASEALLGADIPRPVKMLPFMKPYRDMERRVQLYIEQKFQVSAASDQVHHADNVMLATEAVEFMPNRPAPWQALPAAIAGFIFYCYSPDGAKQAFLDRFIYLTAREQPHVR